MEEEEERGERESVSMRRQLGDRHLVDMGVFNLVNSNIIQYTHTDFISMCTAYMYYVLNIEHLHIASSVSAALSSFSYW